MKRLTRNQMKKLLGGLEENLAECTVKCAGRQDITCSGGGCNCETNVGCSCSANESGHSKLCSDSPVKTLN